MEFAVQTRGSMRHIRSVAHWAESQDLAAIALPDHYLPVFGDASEGPAYDHFIHLAALATETKSIELVCLVAPVGFRHPAVLYKMGVTLDEISNGRFTLGVGTGWYEEEFKLFGLDYPSEKVRIQQRHEALAYLSGAIHGEGNGYDGEHFQLAEFKPKPAPQNLRLLTGGAGMVKTPLAAGTYADEFNIYACPPEDFRVKVERTREAAEAAGRDPESILISCAGPAVAGPEKADYERLRDEMAGLVGVDAGRIDGGYRKRKYPTGWGSTPSEMVAELEDLGCSRYYLQMFVGNEDDRDMVLSTYRGI